MSARVSQKPLVQTSPDFLCMLPVAMARCFCDNSATRYVLPVLWMMSCLHIMTRQRRRQWVVCLVSSDSPRATAGTSCTTNPQQIEVMEFGPNGARTSPSTDV